MKGKLEYWTEILFRVVYSSSISNIWVWIILAVTLVFAVNLNQLRFNYNIEGFFSNQDSEVARYENFKNKFGNENNVLLIGIESRVGIFNQDFLSKIDTISTALKSIEAVRKVISPTNLREYIATPTTGLIPIPIIHVNDPKKYAIDSTKIYNNGIYLGSFFSKENPCISIVIDLKEGMRYSENELLLTQIGELMSNPYFDIRQYHLAGRIQTQHYYISTMKREMALFSLLALVLFSTSIWLIFRRVIYVINPTGIVYD